jgi:putative pyruvate formate lyase activating enzyme
MWNALRPDAVEVLDDIKARNSLEKYFKILEGKRLPKFTACKSMAIGVPLDDSDEVLWRDHDKVLKSLKETDFKTDEPKKDEPSLLDLKVELANRIYKECVFCELKCRVNRIEKAGVCGVKKPKISSAFSHFGEEPELVPSYTVFFSGCNFSCQFCQNYDISQRITGYELSSSELAGRLDSISVRNINWVGGSPTPNLKYILETLNNYNGNMPCVWNSNMYMSETSMRLLDGTQDIFLTDFKFGNDECASRLSKIKNYTAIVKRNHILAKDQAELIVRHLVLPDHVDCCTREVANFIAQRLGQHTRFNLMFQYHPTYHSHKRSEINRALSREEISKAMEVVKDAGLVNVIK